VAAPFQLLVEVIEQKIGEQRGQRAALRRAFVALDAQASLHHPGFQEAADDLQQAFVANAPRQTSHQNVVVDPIEGSCHPLPISTIFPVQ
jgi:hypothetical protein